MKRHHRRRTLALNPETVRVLREQHLVAVAGAQVRTGPVGNCPTLEHDLTCETCSDYTLCDCVFTVERCFPSLACGGGA